MTRREIYLRKIQEASDNELFQLAKKFLLHQYSGFSHNDWKLEIIIHEAEDRKIDILTKAEDDTVLKIKSIEDKINNNIIDIKRLDFMTETELSQFLIKFQNKLKKVINIENINSNSDTLIESFGYNPSKAFLSKITGTSMQNSHIFDGSTILVDRSILPIANDVVLISIFDELFVKRLKEFDGFLWLYSENEEYQPIKITSDLNLKIMGVVRKVILDVR